MVNINKNRILFQRVKFIKQIKIFILQVLGYQFGLCLICTQFTTSGIQLVNNITTVHQNSTTSMEKQS